jgi:Tol biopolymer transport system component
MMKRKILTEAIVLLMAMQVNLFCKKETSSEGCKEFNKSPISIAGPDQVVTLPTDSVSLDGSASGDPDGTINEFLWKRIAGPVSFNIVNATTVTTYVKNLTTGIYLFELTVKDNEGLQAKDTIQITVSDPFPSNRPPVANAGFDQSITLPANSLRLDGSRSTDPDNNSINYLWEKISGPAFFNIVSPIGVQTEVTNLTEGVYLFELTVSDAGRLSSKDTVEVTVVNPPIPCTDCKIVFTSARDGNHEIYSCNKNGSNIIQLTTDPGIDDQPVWSPDGTRIAFISNRTGDFEIYIMNADGTNVVRRTFSGGLNPTWSPDGMKIAYSNVSNGSANIWVVGSTSGSPSLLLEVQGWEAYPSWSPDGTKIAVVSDWMAYDIVFDLYTINADGTGFTTLTGNMFDKYDYLCPGWSPNGTKLAMAINESVGIDQYNTQVGVINPDGSGIAVLKSGAAPWTRTSWSADGSTILYTSLSGTRTDISWVSSNGAAWGTIVTNGWNANLQH